MTDFQTSSDLSADLFVGLLGESLDSLEKGEQKNDTA